MGLLCGVPLLRHPRGAVRVSQRWDWRACASRMPRPPASSWCVQAHQAAALDALAAWLEAEPPRVEARLREPDTLPCLVTLLPAGAAAGAALGAAGALQWRRCLEWVHWRPAPH